MTEGKETLAYMAQQREKVRAGKVGPFPGEVFAVAYAAFSLNEDDIDTLDLDHAELVRRIQADLLELARVLEDV